MNELLAFFVRNSRWFVFVAYATISTLLLMNDDPYRRHVWLTSANEVTAQVYGVSNQIGQYFDLRQINEDLNRRNAMLQSEVLYLRDRLTQLGELELADSLKQSPEIARRPFDFIVATVINNSISRPYNYLTINKGSADGILPELGVIDQNGVVGIVSVVGEHNSRVISLLNPNLQLSCKIRSSDSYGSLVWDGRNPREALLTELPRHTVYSVGDTVVTSGYSAVFPAGLPVAVVIDQADNSKQNFFSLRVRLFSDFTTLSNVQVVMSNRKAELDSLSRQEQNYTRRNTALQAN